MFSLAFYNALTHTCQKATSKLLEVKCHWPFRQPANQTSDHSNSIKGKIIVTYLL